MFKKGGLVMTIWNLIVGAGLIALGIATCVNYSNSDYRNVIIMIAGIFVILDAALRLVTQVIQVVRFQDGAIVKADLASAITVASELSVGILMIMVSQKTADIQIVLQYLILFISILLIAVGAIALLFCIVFLVKKVGSVFRAVVGLIMGAVLITGGVLILVYATQEAMLQFIFIMLGVTLMLAGLGVIIFGIAYAIAASRAKKEIKEELVVENEEPIESESDEEGEEKEEENEDPKELEKELGEEENDEIPEEKSESDEEPKKE